MRWLERSRIVRTSQSEGDLLRRSLLAALDRDFDQVEALVSRLVRRNSSDVDAYLALGCVYRERDELGRAIALHQTLVLRRDLDVRQRMDVLGELAADFRQGGFTHRAIAAYEEVLAHDGRRAEALAAMVDLLIEAGEPERAWKVLRRLERVQGRARASRRAEVLLAIATKAREDGRPDAARRAVRRAKRMDPDHLATHVLDAELELARGRTRSALQAWQRAVAIAPDRAGDLLEQAGHAMTAKGERPAFEAMLRAQIADAGDAVAPVLALADLLVHDGRSDEARVFLQDAVARCPEAVEAHVALGRLLVSMSGESPDPQLVERYRELLDVLSQGRKPEGPP